MKNRTFKNAPSTEQPLSIDEAALVTIGGGDHTVTGDVSKDEGLPENWEHAITRRPIPVR